MIYCVEDDNGIRDLMIYTLNASELEAKGFISGEELYPALDEAIPELILLDVMLPGDDGITILRKLKEDPKTSDIPVIMASAKGTEYDKVIGLDLGADDYLAKPFGMMEMVARVRAVLRRSGAVRSEEKNDQLLVNGGIIIEDAYHRVTVCDRQIQLTLKEYELLKMFMTDLGRAFTRNQILSSVWGTDYIGESRTVDVHVGTLRSKLGECGEYIETVWGVGYKMEIRP